MSRKLFPQGPRFFSPFRQITHRYASNSPLKATSQGNTRYTRIRARLDRWIVRSPRLFKPTLITLRDAPTSYLISFAILHELTAIVPLASLTYAFHYYRWLPPYFAEGKWVTEGVEKYGRYFRRKGWLQDYDQVEIERETKEGKALEIEGGGILGYWDRGNGTGRWLVELATAYAVTKVLLPLRIALSVLWAPGFARSTLIPITGLLRRGLKR